MTQIVYINIPWTLDENDYNCSGRTREEWRQRGTVREFQAACFLIFGLLLQVIYILSMVAMVRGKLLRIPCYRLMFFNGFLDLMVLTTGALIVAYFQYTGAVFCTDVRLDQYSGQIAWSAYMGSTFMCIAVGFNRFVEMIPSMRKLVFLFRGKMIYMWMVVCVLIMIIRPFFCRPALYNSTFGTFLALPAISDDLSWESKHYATWILTITNMSFLVLLVLPYVVVCHHVLRLSSSARANIDKGQAILFSQAIVICSTNAVAAILYNIMKFVVLPRSVVIASHIIWLLSHGIHGVVYLCINKHIRKEVKGIFGFKTKVTMVSTSKIAFRFSGR
ncbi:hypothetical protein V3C99_006907 [Haemonchus contortus]